jgi:nitrogen-specific signal transduction histidine kinase
MKLFRVQKFNSTLYLTNTKRAIANKGLRLYSDTHAVRGTVQSLHLKLDALSFKYNAVFNTRGNHCIILNRQLNIVDFNLAAANLLRDVFNSRLNKGDFIGRYLNTPVRNSLLDNCTRALNGENFMVERRIDLPSGLVMWLQVDYSATYNRQQHIEGVIFNAVDITDRKLHEQKIEQQNQKLRQISLIYSHDVRAPLCTLMGLISLLKTEGGIPNPDYILMIDATIDLLDSQIKAVVNSASQ